MATGEYTGVTLQGMKTSDRDYQFKRLENVLASINHEIGQVKDVLEVIRQLEKDKYSVKLQPKQEERKPYSQDE